MLPLGLCKSVPIPPKVDDQGKYGHSHILCSWAEWLFQEGTHSHVHQWDSFKYSFQWLEKGTFLHWVTKKAGSLHGHFVTKKKAMPELCQSRGNASWEMDRFRVWMMLLSPWTQHYLKAVLWSHQWASKFPFFC